MNLELSDEKANLGATRKTQASVDGGRGKATYWWKMAMDATFSQSREPPVYHDKYSGMSVLISANSHCITKGFVLDQV